MMTDDLSIRSARPEDADRAAVLLYSAYSHRQVSYPLPEDGENRFVERLEHFFREAGNRFSYQNIQVAEQQGEVVGLVLSFGGREEARLNAAIGWPLEREAQEDEWYADALAVFTNWGRQGIGTRLLQAVEQQARRHGYAKIALNVARENVQALSLYQRLQYVVTGETLLYHHPYVRLVKRLDNA
jgi:ribosomal protein S18 acetylase RimI-like enzyme